MKQNKAPAKRGHAARDQEQRPLSEASPDYRVEVQRRFKELPLDAPIRTLVQSNKFARTRLRLPEEASVRVEEVVSDFFQKNKDKSIKAENGYIDIESSGSTYRLIWSRKHSFLKFENIVIVQSDGNFAEILIYKWHDKPQGETLNSPLEQNAASGSFNVTSSNSLCVPRDGKATLYLGKRASGDVHEFLTVSYPYREGGEPLTLKWLETHDPKAYRALYTQSTPETGSPAGFLNPDKLPSAALLAKHSIDLSTPEGVEEATRLHGILHGWLYNKTKLKIG